MALNLQDKQAIVSKIGNIVKRALSVVVVDFRGITADKMNKLRETGRKSGVYIFVVRNTLLYRAVKDSQFECLKDIFVGSTLIAFSMEHPSTAARLFKEFLKSNIEAKIKAAAFEGRLISAMQIDRLAMMPTYEEILVSLILVMKEAAAGKLVRIISAICCAKGVV